MATFDTWGGSWGTSWLTSWFREIPVVPVNTAIFTTGIFKAAQTTGDLTTGFTDGMVTAGQTTGRFK